MGQPFDPNQQPGRPVPPPPPGAPTPPPAPGGAPTSPPPGAVPSQPGPPPGAPPGPPGSPPGYPPQGGGYQTPPPGAAPYQPPPAAGAPKKKSRVWVWILVAVLALVVLCGGGAIVGGVFIFKAATAPVDTTNEWLNDVRAGNTSAAQSDTCSGESAADFAEYIEFYTGSITSHNMNNVDVTNDVASVSGTITGSDGTVPFVFGLVDQDGWKVCSVS